MPAAELMVDLTGVPISVGPIEVTAVQLLRGHDNRNVVDIVATSDRRKVVISNACLCEREWELDDPALVFGVLLVHGCAGWFCPECRRLVGVAPREAFQPKSRVNLR